jgi:hypothetical protein
MATEGSDVRRSSPPPGDAARPKVETRITNHPPSARSLLFASFSVIYETPGRPNHVYKVPSPWPELELAHEVERRIYQRLGEHPNLAKVVEMDQYGIWLQRAL